ncbi:MAG: SPASM domain-containing protein, partial [Spirochaetales bacterium]|nr:SPASM domain-containing protein [Spirochaetales bacterium]
IIDEDLTKEDTRKTVDLLMDLTKGLYEDGLKKEILTVDNHADGVYLYLRLKEEDPGRAEDVLSLLKMNGGNSTGNGIGCVSWDGEVYADQFWRHTSFGNVKKRPFSEIWTDLSNPLMAKLKDKNPHVKGRCAKCIYLDLCGGNFRVRAEAVTGDLWAEDPACFLTDKEIGIN